jgi:tripartite-type tricarboxylate transporter receptor subunit TctC
MKRICNGFAPDVGGNRESGSGQFIVEGELMKTILLAAAAAFLLCAPARAQTYPSRAISLIVPLAPGSQPDNVARVLAEKLRGALGAPVLVENRPGADGMIGTEAVARSAPDGYTLLFAISGPLTIAPALYAGRIRYDSEKDFAPIAQVTRVIFVVTANPRLGVQNLDQLTAYTRANPKTAALGYLPSFPHLMALRLKQATGADVELIGYNGPAQILTDMLGGRIHAAVEALSTAQAQIQAGKIKALATLGSSRSPAIPDVPTVREQGYPEIEAEGWHGLLARAGTPASVIERLYQEIVRAMSLPDVQERLRKAGTEVKTSDPKTVARMIREDTERWARIVRDFNVRPEN